MLQAAYGSYRARGVERPCGSLLSTDSVADMPGLNFLSDAAADYAGARADEVVESGGTLEVQRLRHNMLSSMPLCFSIFGELRAQPDGGLSVITALFDPDAIAVEAIECEWKPDTNPLADRTAFDAMIVTRRRDGTRHLIGIETKYTEPFSRTPYSTDTYAATHQACGWFLAGTEDQIAAECNEPTLAQRPTRRRLRDARNPRRLLSGGLRCRARRRRRRRHGDRRTPHHLASPGRTACDRRSLEGSSRAT